MNIPSLYLTLHDDGRYSVQSNGGPLSVATSSREALAVYHKARDERGSWANGARRYRDPETPQVFNSATGDFRVLGLTLTAEFEHWRSEMHNAYGPNRRDWPAEVRETESRLLAELVNAAPQEPAR